ncbi:MAG: cytochrome c peroxidase [Gemmatimonadales bacterium]
MPIRAHRWIPVLVLAAACTASSKDGPDVDAQLADLLAKANVTALTVPAQVPAQVALGQALMFDKILSGNKNISCASCHHPVNHTGGGGPLPIGEGATGLDPARNEALGAIIPRHAPELFNRGASQWQFMFWDGRVAVKPGGGFNTPAGASLPAGVASVLAAQAMFPVESPGEMRGQAGENGLANIPAGNFPLVWDSLMRRLRAIPKYDTLFRAAFNKSVDSVGFEFAANAIAAFEASAFEKHNSPFDQYLAGNLSALTDQQKRGALLFFGKANCAKCHNGPLLTDQKFHNIAVPQLGPGRGPVAGMDAGLQETTGSPSDAFKFRTPPLRNVALTPPYFHNGAFATLLAATEHYVNVTRSLQTYSAGQLPVFLQGTVVTDPAKISQVLATLDPIVADTLTIQASQVTDIVAFLQSLTDPTAASLTSVVPGTVPSGLAVGD